MQLNDISFENFASVCSSLLVLDKNPFSIVLLRLFLFLSFSTNNVPKLSLEKRVSN